MRRTLPVWIVSGPSGSGKTTLIEKLIPALARRGVSVATVKHHRHPVRVDQPGKDTWRHREAGAKATFFVTEDEVVGFWDRAPDMGPAQFAELCPEFVHVLMVEGFKGLTGYPRIEVVRKDVERDFLCTEEVLCVATDVMDLPATCPVFGLDDVEGIADLLARRLSSGDF